MWRASALRAHINTAVLAVGESEAVANLANELTDDPRTGITSWAFA